METCYQNCLSKGRDGKTENPYYTNNFKRHLKDSQISTTRSFQTPNYLSAFKGLNNSFCQLDYLIACKTMENFPDKFMKVTGKTEPGKHKKN